MAPESSTVANLVRAPLRLPVRTLRLAWRFLLPLSLWFVVGELLRYLIVKYAAAWMERVPVAGLLALTLMIMVSVLTTVAMLHALRPGMPRPPRRGETAPVPWDPYRRETIADALARCLLPFLAIYLGWSLMRDDARTLAGAAGSSRTDTPGLGDTPDGYDVLLSLEQRFLVAVLLTVVFFALRVAAERWLTPASPRAGTAAVAFFEIGWTLFAIFALARVIEAVARWLGGRVLWSWITTPLHELTTAAPWLGAVGGVWPGVKEAVVAPLLWLVIAALVLGTVLDEPRKASGSGIAAIVRRSLRDKWVPPVNGLRLVARAGMPLFAWFCVLYVALEVVREQLQRLVVALIGPHHEYFWWTALAPVDVVSEWAYQVLRVTLLAAVVTVMVGRVTRYAEARQAPVSEGTAS